MNPNQPTWTDSINAVAFLFTAVWTVGELGQVIRWWQEKESHTEADDPMDLTQCPREYGYFDVIETVEMDTPSFDDLWIG